LTILSSFEIRAFGPTFSTILSLSKQILIGFIGEWKALYNENFNYTEFGTIVRDYVSVNQLICLSNMESLNSVLINDGVPQSERLQKLNQIAISQMTVLESVGEHKLIK
jgi:hypothetical protein